MTNKINWTSKTWTKRTAPGCTNLKLYSRSFKHPLHDDFKLMLIAECEKDKFYRFYIAKNIAQKRDEIYMSQHARIPFNMEIRHVGIWAGIVLADYLFKVYQVR